MAGCSFLFLVLKFLPSTAPCKTWMRNIPLASQRATKQWRDYPRPRQVKAVEPGIVVLDVAGSDGGRVPAAAVEKHREGKELTASRETSRDHARREGLLDYL